MIVSKEDPELPACKAQIVKGRVRTPDMGVLLCPGVFLGTKHIVNKEGLRIPGWDGLN